MATEAFGEEGQVKLLGAPESPFVLRVCIALALKGINYQLIPENPYNKSELLLQSNPVHKKVPVLIHNGKPVCESMIIVQYIDEVWGTKGPNFMPKDPYDRAIARFWAAFVDDKLLPCIRGVFCGQGEALHKAAEELVTNIVLIEEALKTSSCFSGKPYFGGDEIGFLDIALGGFLASFLKALQKATDTVLIDPEIMPLLCAWIDRFCEYDTVKEVMPDPAKQLEILSAGRATYLASLSPGN
uniref:glutathione transferase n=1 Tax=Larix kaempferi TaxID=54800 RepID=V5L5W0_9CONI|nr:tau class glutathione S-transferase [Larix kaempferi]